MCKDDKPTEIFLQLLKLPVTLPLIEIDFFDEIFLGECSGARSLAPSRSSDPPLQKPSYALNVACRATI